MDRGVGNIVAGLIRIQALVVCADIPKLGDDAQVLFQLPLVDSTEILGYLYFQILRRVAVELGECTESDPVQENPQRDIPVLYSLVVDVRVVAVAICKTVKCGDQMGDISRIAGIGTVVCGIQIVCLGFTVLVREVVREKGAQMPFDLQNVFQKQFPEIFIKPIERNNILKGGSVTVLLGGRILKGVLYPLIRLK